MRASQVDRYTEGWTRLEQARELGKLRINVAVMRVRFGPSLDLLRLIPTPNETMRKPSAYNFRLD